MEALSGQLLMPSPVVVVADRNIAVGFLAVLPLMFVSAREISTDWR